MKSYLFVFILIFSSLSPLRAQQTKWEEDDKTMGLSVSPLSMIFGGFHVLYQYKLTSYLALTVPAHFTYDWIGASIDKWASDLSGSETTMSPIGAGGGVGARFLLANKGLQDSFYLEPRLALEYQQKGSVSKLGEESFASEMQELMLTPSLRFGYDWYYDSGFSLSFGGHVGYAFFLKNNNKIPPAIKEFKNKYPIANFLFPSDPDSLGKIQWGLNFMIGYAW